MGKHRNKGKPGYRGRWPQTALAPEPVIVACLEVVVKASAAEIAALSSAQRQAFMGGIATIIS